MNERLMKKIARPSYWDKIEGGLRKITNLPGPVHAVLGNRDKLKFHHALPPGIAPNAKAYVTTEDTDDDGNIETINIVVTNLEKEWPQDILSRINQMDESDPVFQDILNGIAKTLIHELAHIDDHKDGSFPGGEGVAESRENSFTPNFAAASITNADNKVISPLGLSKIGDIKMKKELIKLATHLDKLGHSDLADRLDAIVKSAQGLTDFLLDPADVKKTEGEIVQDEQYEEPPTDPYQAQVLAEAMIKEEADKITGESVGGQSILDAPPDAPSVIASNRIDEMAKLISKEFSLTSRGNVSRG
jgi:hypothetical protein